MCSFVVNTVVVVFQLVLAMGNYLNKGNARVDQASGFKVNFLTQVRPLSAALFVPCVSTQAQLHLRFRGPGP